MPSEPDWNTVKDFRHAMRKELLARRGMLDMRERQRRGESAKTRLLAELDLRIYPVLGIYWPIKGEFDLREVARRHIESGGTAALPVVIEKNSPVEFWRWEPGAATCPGFWNIPVPVERRPVVPDALLIPLVGFDTAGYRLGYGGGYYDRTIAAAAARPLCIGVGYAEAELATIHPQTHDIPMSLIVTERRTYRFARELGVRSRPVAF